MKDNLYPAGAFAIAAIGVILLAPISSNPALYAQQQIPNTQTTESVSGTPVEIGAGSNATVQYYQFSPQTVEINTGESVTWTSPSQLSDIHTVTFVLDQNVMSDAILPFTIPDQSTASDFRLLPPFNAGEPVTVQTPDGRNAIVALNKLVWYPAAIDANNQTTFINGSNGSIEYTIDGTQKAVNSGIIVSAGPPMAEQSNENMTGTSSGNMTEATSEGPQPPFPPVSSFTMTFEEPGTYPYFCAIHPWMGGQVVVTDNSTSSSTTAQTP